AGTECRGGGAGGQGQCASGKDGVCGMNAEVKPGYKKTEVGLIPKDWFVTTLGKSFGKITTGKLDANAMSASGEYPFFTCAKEVYRINHYAFDCDALLISGNGANVGYVHHHNGNFNAYQ